jgi:hypothetical protein
MMQGWWKGSAKQVSITRGTLVARAPLSACVLCTARTLPYCMLNSCAWLAGSTPHTSRPVQARKTWRKQDSIHQVVRLPLFSATLSAGYSVKKEEPVPLFLPLFLPLLLMTCCTLLKGYTQADLPFCWGLYRRSYILLASQRVCLPVGCNFACS